MLKPAQSNPTTQFFTGRMLFLMPHQQRQSTKGILPLHGAYIIWVSMSH